MGDHLKGGCTMKKKITIGILAHVDVGKTTLGEALLHASGKIRTFSPFWCFSHCLEILLNYFLKTY